MFLVMYVSHNIEQADAVLRTWVEVGIDGATILESAGMQQLTSKVRRDDWGIMPTLESVLRSSERHHRTIFSVVEDEALVKRLVQATTDYVKDWNKADVGVLIVLPVLQAFGLQKGFA